MERFQVIIDHVGNVSGASALIALNEALCEGKLQPGDIACMTAFGGGLTAGSCVIRILTATPATKRLSRPRRREGGAARNSFYGITEMSAAPDEPLP